MKIRLALIPSLSRDDIFPIPDYSINSEKRELRQSRRLKIIFNLLFHPTFVAAFSHASSKAQTNIFSEVGKYFSAVHYHSTTPVSAAKDQLHSLNYLLLVAQTITKKNRRRGYSRTQQNNLKNISRFR